jgi:outer membrane protein OmpU
MKKVLFATTALVVFAGAAAADVTLSGNARMGVIYDDEAGEANFTSRARVIFNLSGQSDAGIDFGATFRADNAAAANNSAAGEVFVSGAFGRLAMGDVDGALLSAVGHLYGVGLTGLGDFNEIVTISPVVAERDPALLYSYSAGGLGFFASINDGDSDGTSLIDGLATTRDTIWSVGLTYSVAGVALGLGYEDDGDADHVAISAEGTFGGVSLKAMYGEGGGTISGFDQWGVSAKSTFGATTVAAFYNEQGGDDAYGLGADYSLGGGAFLTGGLVDGDRPGGLIADFGIRFTF